MEAVAADPSYPLAQFNLGNSTTSKAASKRLSTTTATLELNPNYADAHFNWHCCASAPATR